MPAVNAADTDDHNNASDPSEPDATEPNRAIDVAGQAQPTDDGPEAADSASPAANTEDVQPATAEQETTEAAVIEVGKLQSADQVLVRWQQPDVWMRLPPGAQLFTADQLVVPPSYSPRLSLANGLELTCHGPCGGIHLEPPIDQSTPSVALHYGRLVLTSGSQGGAASRCSAARVDNC